MSTDVIFEPLKFRNLAVKTRIFRRNSRDAVSTARSFGAKSDLVRTFAAGHNRPPVPCTYCNNCLVNAVENPFSYYDETRFRSRDEIVKQIMTVFDPPPFV